MTGSIYAVSTGSLQRLLGIAKRNNWNEITYDCREELQRRAAQRGGRSR